MTSDKNPTSLRVAILGGGISGLSAAWQISRRAPTVDVEVFESSDRWGGVIRTEYADGFLIEHSADMLSTIEPWAVELCQELGIAGELVGTDERFRRAFVVRRGRLYPVPDGFALLEPRRLWPLLTSPLLSWRGKVRLLSEIFIPARQTSEDESLADFATRRFGREVFQRLVQPLISGIYTADPYQLSMQATLNRFVLLEREHGSLIRASWRVGSRRTAGRPSTQGAGARYGAFVAPRQGMQSIVDALVGQLRSGKLWLQRPVVRLTPTAAKWSLVWRDSSGHEKQDTFDAVIIALPSAETASLVRPWQPSLATLLCGIPTASVAIAIFGIARAEVQHRLNGFGFVCPLVERRAVLAGSFSSVKFPGRAPEGYVLVRLFMGGACQPELLERDDSQLLELAKQELTALLGFHGTPRLERIIRWYNTMPQYHVGHVQRVMEIEQQLQEFPTLALAGNAYRGVGVPWCIQSGRHAADKILGVLLGRSASADDCPNYGRNAF